MRYVQSQVSRLSDSLGSALIGLSDTLEVLIKQVDRLAQR